MQVVVLRFFVMSFSRIRTYMRRSGRMTSAQKKALNGAGAQYLLSEQKLAASSVTWFMKPQPLVLEIGFGMGENIVAMAQRNPALNYLGVDVYQPGVGALLTQCVRYELENVRVVMADVHDVLAHLPIESCQQINLFFPDPWPKKRHHKRRLIQPDFVNELLRVLSVGGMLHIATDHSEYAEHIATCLLHPNLTQLDTFSDTVRIQTKYEQRGLRLGSSITEYHCQRT